MNKFVLVLDSGVGGISVLKECIKLMPNENFLYVADNKHAPYGNKTKRRLNKIALKNILYYTNNYNIKLILLACNTLTATSIEYLRRKTNYTYVGVEPAIKKAVEKGNKNILLISSNATLKHNKKLHMYRQKLSNKTYFYPLKDLAKKIDDNLNDLNAVQPYLDKTFINYKNKNINSVVLGCTHYKFVKEQIKKALSKNINFYESSVGTAKRVHYLLNKKNALKQFKQANILVFCTKKNLSLNKKLIYYLQKD
jgi:glutamate racemase